MLAFRLGAPSPERYARLTVLLLVGYLGYAILLGVVATAWQRALPSKITLATQLVDVTMFGVLMYISTVSRSPSSPYLVLFTLPMAAATLRWQARGVLWTSAAALTMTVIMATWQSRIARDPAFEVNRSILHGVYIIVMAAVLGYLSAFERRHRREIGALAAWPKAAPNDLNVLLTGNLGQATELLRMPRAVLIWEDPDEPWIEIAEWTGTKLRMWREPQDALMPMVAEAVVAADFFVEDAASPDSKVILLTAAGRRQWRGPSIHAGLVDRFSLGRVLGLQVAGDLANGWLFLAGSSAATADDLVLGGVAEQLIADALDLFLLGRRSSTLAVLDEREQLSHELHDGVLQSLAGIALQLSRAEQMVTSDPSASRSVLQDMQRLLLDEQRDLRLYVQNLRDYTVGNADAGAGFELRLRDFIRRVESVWQVPVTVTVGQMDRTMTGAQEHELFRIAQEAVVNAVRHGGADEVRVEITRQDDVVRMAVEDNGHGFPFRGRHDDTALAEGRLGPVTLKARVKALGGRMTIESSERGARLAVTVPLTNVGG